MMKQNKVPAMVDVQARFAGQAPLAATTSSSCSWAVDGPQQSRAGQRIPDTARRRESEEPGGRDAESQSESEWYQTGAALLRSAE